MTSQTLDQLKIIGIASVPAADCAAGQAQLRVFDDAVGIEKLPDTETIALRARGGRVIKGERPW